MDSLYLHREPSSQRLAEPSPQVDRADTDAPDVMATSQVETREVVAGSEIARAARKSVGDAGYDEDDGFHPILSFLPDENQCGANPGQVGVSSTDDYEPWRTSLLKAKEYPLPKARSTHAMLIYEEIVLSAYLSLKGLGDRSTDEQIEYLMLRVQDAVNQETRYDRLEDCGKDVLRAVVEIINDRVLPRPAKGKSKAKQQGEYLLLDAKSIESNCINAFPEAVKQALGVLKCGRVANGEVNLNSGIQMEEVLRVAQVFGLKATTRRVQSLPTTDDDILKIAANNSWIDDPKNIPSGFTAFLRWGSYSQDRHEQLCTREGTGFAAVGAKRKNIGGRERQRESELLMKAEASKRVKVIAEEDMNYQLRVRELDLRDKKLALEETRLAMDETQLGFERLERLLKSDVPESMKKAIYQKMAQLAGLDWCSEGEGPTAMMADEPESDDDGVLLFDRSNRRSPLRVLASPNVRRSKPPK